jgi:hypothetical protein
MTDMQINDAWFGIDGDLDGSPYIVRGREDLSAFQESGLYQIRIDIVWNYCVNNDSMLPDNDLLALMEKTENLLVDQLEGNLEAILALVFTGNAQRVWYWYCKDVIIASKRINIALSAIAEKLPLEIYSTQDPDWNEYNNWVD